MELGNFGGISVSKRFVCWPLHSLLMKLHGVIFFREIPILSDILKQMEILTTPHKFLPDCFTLKIIGRKEFFC